MNIASRVLSGLFCLAVLAGHGAHAGPRGGGSSFQVVGYVTDGAALPKITPDKLDVINFAFAHVGEDHRVILSSTTATQRLRDLVELRHDNPLLKIVLSVGGWGAGNFSEAVADADARRAFVESSVELILAHDLDGLDIDWEYPTQPGPGISHSPADRRNFSLLIEELRARFDALGHERGRHYLLTIAAADGEAARGLELARIARSLDWINLMSYDFYGSFEPLTGHHASLYRSASAAPGSRSALQGVDEFLHAGVPPRKLNLGVGFYARHFEEVEPGNHGLNRPYHKGGGYLSWQEVSSDYMHREGYVRYWDEQAKAPWLWSEKERHFIGYDDPQSLHAKAAFVRKKGLRGIMYWEHATDANEELLDAVNAGLNRQMPESNR